MARSKKARVALSPRAVRAVRVVRGAVKGPAVARPDNKKDRAEAERLIADIRGREVRVVRNFYQMGLALSKLAAPAMYRALGYTSFDAMLRGEQLMSRARAYKLILVVDTYPAKHAVRLGLERAYGLIDWARHAPTDEPPAQLAARNVKIGGRPVAEVSVRALRAETKRLRSGGPSPRVDRARERAEEVAERVERALRRRGVKDPRASAVREGKKWRVQTVVDVDDALALIE